MLYSCRTVPPLLQIGLRQADLGARHSLGRLVGCPLADDDWRFASIGVAHGRLAAAARLSTLLLLTSPAWLRLRNSALASGQVMMNMTWTVASCVSMSRPLLELLFFTMQVFTTLLVPHPRRVFLPRLKPRFVSICQHLLDSSSHDRHRVAHLSLNRIPGAGAWLFAHPDSLESHIRAPLFRVSLRRRFRMPIWNSVRPAHRSGGDHALVCGCGGDRVTRHNLVCDVVHSAANNTARLGAGAASREAWVAASS